MATPNFGVNSGGPASNVPGWSSSGGANAGTGGGQNQWMSYPSLPNFSPTSTQFNPSATPLAGQKPGQYGEGAPGGTQNLGANTFTAPTMDPQFTNQFYQYLSQMLGQSSGAQNNILSFLSGGPTSLPGAGTLSNLATTGAPVDQTPAWQAMIQAENQNTALGQTQLKEQFGSMGNLSSSSAADAMSQYMQQTTLGQNAQLTAAQAQAQENAANRSLTASSGIQSEAASMDQFMQSLLSQGALSSPQIFQKQPSGMGQLLGGVGSLIGGAGQLAGAASDAGGIGALMGALI